MRGRKSKSQLRATLKITKNCILHIASFSRSKTRRKWWLIFTKSMLYFVETSVLEYLERDCIIFISDDGVRILEGLASSKPDDYSKQQNCKRPSPNQVLSLLERLAISFTPFCFKHNFFLYIFNLFSRCKIHYML
jgi:hypothetical protein